MNNSPKFTSGQWSIEVERPNGFTVYSLVNTQGAEYGAESKANASLIAAAPRMYNLLHSIWSKTDPSKDYELCKQISNILDKVDRGEHE